MKLNRNELGFLIDTTTIMMRREGGGKKKGKMEFLREK